MERANGAIWRESLVSPKWRRWCQFHLQAARLKEPLPVNMIEREQFCALPRTELCEAKVGRFVAQIGNHSVKSGSTLQSLTAFSVGEAEFYAVVKGGPVGLSLRSIFMGLGIPMQVETQSGSSRANSLTDQLGARPQYEAHRFTFLSGTRASSRWRSQKKKVLTAKKLCRC